MPDEATIRRLLRKGTIDRKFVPMLCGTAFKNKGVQPLLDAVVSYLPSPVEIEDVQGERVWGGWGCGIGGWGFDGRWGEKGVEAVVMGRGDRSSEMVLSPFPFPSPYVHPRHPHPHTSTLPPP